MKKETVIGRVAEALKNDCGSIFVGSGISYRSTEVDWFKLLEPLTIELDIKIDNENDDLPLIAQYIVNHTRTLLHFFQLRCCGRAQWEIRS